MERKNTQRAIILAIAIMLVLASCFDFLPKFPDGSLATQVGTANYPEANIQATSVSDSIQKTFVSYVAVVISDGLNVRSGPGTDYPILYQLSKGDIITVLDDATIPDYSPELLCWEWARIAYEQFVCRKFLK
jgi:hypothetical protein